MLDARLVVVGGEAGRSEIQLSLPTSIGRGTEADIVISDNLVSRRHAEIYELDGLLYVRDLGSLNGTFVNNQKIVDSQPIEPEQLLTLGTVTFRAIYQASPTVSQSINSADSAAVVSRNSVMDTVRFDGGVDQTIRISSDSSLVENDDFATNIISNLETSEYDSDLVNSQSAKKSVSRAVIETIEDGVWGNAPPSEPELETSQDIERLKKIPR